MSHSGDELMQHVAHRDTQRGGVYTWVAAEIFVAEQVVVDKKMHAVLSIVHQPQYTDGAGGDVQQLLHVLCGCEGQPRGAYICFDRSFVLNGLSPGRSRR